MKTAPPTESPIRPTTQALATLQTTINAAGIAFFEGDLDRFGIFALILAQTHRDIPNARPIAVYSLAMSLGRPFETVRRHVAGLLGAGLCARFDGKIGVSDAVDEREDIGAVCALTHDAFVQFIATMKQLDLLPPLPAATRAYVPIFGIAAAAETLLAAVSSNRDLHDDWLSLAVFSAVLLANAQRYATRAPLGGVPLGERDTVRSAAVARVLHVPETTIRRRLGSLCAPGAPLLRLPAGLVVSTEWLASERAAITSGNTYSVVRLILARLATHGFPFGDPPSAYLGGPPPAPPFD